MSLWTFFVHWCKTKPSPNCFLVCSLDLQDISSTLMLQDPLYLTKHIMVDLVFVPNHFYFVIIHFIADCVIFSSIEISFSRFSFHVLSSWSYSHIALRNMHSSSHFWELECESSIPLLSRSRVATQVFYDHFRPLCTKPVVNKGALQSKPGRTVTNQGLGFCSNAWSRWWNSPNSVHSWFSW